MTIIWGVRKLPARYAGIVTPFFLSILMTCIVSFISTAKEIGISPLLVHKWMGAWAISWIIAFPTLLFVLPLVKKLTDLVVVRHGV